MANILSRLQTLLFGAAIGRASSEAVTPVLEPVRQHAWEKNQVRVLDPGTAAAAVVRGWINEGEGASDASKSGVGSSRFGVLERLAQTYPAMAELAKMSNRKILTPAEVQDVIGRHGIPGNLTQAFVDLFSDILSPGELAAAIHRGLIPDPGLLRGEQPTAPFNVEAYPVYQIDALAEAQGSGYDHDRLGVLVGLQGLPMGTHEAAQAVFKGIITHGDYIRAFNESNSRNEWAAAVLENVKQIPTARDFFENALRGYHDLAWAQQQAQRHGMSPEDSLVIYQNQGRPMNVRAITQALARGGVFKPEPGELTDPYEAAIVEGNLKPAYYDLAKALRYTLPSPFVMKALTEAGTWSQAKAEQRLLMAGWIPEDAAEAAAAWAAKAGGTTTTGTSATKSATSAAVRAVQKAYVQGNTSQATATAELTKLGEDATTFGALFNAWDVQRTAYLEGLSNVQIRNRYRNQAISQADALALLERRGLDAASATAYLTG